MKKYTEYPTPKNRWAYIRFIRPRLEFVGLNVRLGGIKINFVEVII